MLTATLLGAPDRKRAQHQDDLCEEDRYCEAVAGRGCGGACKGIKGFGRSLGRWHPLQGGMDLYDRIVMASNISEMIVIIRHIFMSESRIVLRTMLAGMLADAAAPTHMGVA